MKNKEISVVLSAVSVEFKDMPKRPCDEVKQVGSAK